VTDHKPNDELPKDLLDDAEFVALIEQDMRDQDAKEADDELQKKRLWQRLEKDIQPTPEPARRRMIWPWIVAALALLGLIPLFQNQKNQEQDQWKSGASLAPVETTSLGVEREEDDHLKVTFSFAATAPAYLALVQGTEPFTVLWEGPRPDATSWSFPEAETRSSRVCAIMGRDEADLVRKLTLIRELKEIPADAACGDLPPLAP
jgi:hypothetical protein